MTPAIHSDPSGDWNEWVFYHYFWGLIRQTDLTPRRAFTEAEDAHALNNLVTLCAVCHGTEENAPGTTTAPDGGETA